MQVVQKNKNKKKKKRHRTVLHRHAGDVHTLHAYSPSTVNEKPALSVDEGTVSVATQM